jgi:hypothetical protein
MGVVDLRLVRKRVSLEMIGVPRPSNMLFAIMVASHRAIEKMTNDASDYRG